MSYFLTIITSYLELSEMAQVERIDTPIRTGNIGKVKAEV